MSTVCYCGQPDCPVTTWEHDACVANLRAERDALKAQLAKAHERLEEFGMRRDGQTATLEEGIDAMRGQLLDYQRWAYEAEGRASKLKAQLADAEKLNAHYVERIRELQEADVMTQLNEAVGVLKSFADAVQMFDVDFVDAEAEEAAEEALSQARNFLAKVKP